MSDHIFVEPDKLKTGMFVILNLSWLDHPFAFNSFVVQTEAQLATIRGLGLKTVEVDPLRSQIELVPKKVEAKVRNAQDVPAPVETDSASKLIRIERNKALRASLAEADRHAVKAAQTVRQATRDFATRPAEAIGAATTLISDIAQSLLGNSDLMVHLLNDKVAGEEVYYHSLNVSMLALLLGKSLQMDAAMLQTIGMGAIFHDMGKQDIPSRILLKTDELTHSEQELLKEHPRMGAELALRGQLPTPVIAAILQHHERADGKGYPYGLHAEKITPAAKVIAIVNHYDNLCNPINIAQAMTPYEALATMYAKRKGWFDQTMLGRLVHILGVYPPGSIVQLSNGATAMVISVNPARPLQPSILVYDATIPKEEAIILDLEKTPEVSISKALRPATLAPSVYEYLSPRKRVTYYFDSDSSSR